MGRFGTIAAGHRRSSGAAIGLRANPAVPAEFAGQRGGRTIQPHGDGRRFDAHLQLRLDHRSLFNTQLLVDFSHATFSPRNVALGY
jgi:hypothetical protein